MEKKSPYAYSYNVSKRIEDITKDTDVNSLNISKGLASSIHSGQGRPEIIESKDTWKESFESMLDRVMSAFKSNFTDNEIKEMAPKEYTQNTDEAYLQEYANLWKEEAQEERETYMSTTPIEDRVFEPEPIEYFGEGDIAKDPESAITKLLNFIGKGEGDYNSSNSGTDATGKITHSSNNTVRDGKSLSEMTIAEVRPYQEITDHKDANRLFTIGKYQLVPETFKMAVDALGLSDDTVLTEEVQDKMGIYLVSRKRRKLGIFLQGGTGVSTEKAMLELSMEFASSPVPYAIKKGQYGNWPKKDLVEGDSFYSDPKTKKGGNRAFHTVAETRKLLESVKGSLAPEVVTQGYSPTVRPRQEYPTSGFFPTKRP